MTTEDTARPRGGGGGRAVLFIGLALGVVTAILIAVILSGDDDSSEREVPATRSAVVASEDIPARTRITRDMLEVQTYNLEDVDPEAFTTTSQLVNRVTSREVSAGEIVTPSFVSSTVGEGLTFTVSEGMRAISVGVSEVVIAGGNLAPGNYVDIIGLFDVTENADVESILEVFTGEPFEGELPEEIEEGTLTFTLLQNVKVLAVAQDLPPEATEPTNGDDESSFLDTAGPNPSAGTVTLEVTPQQAQTMVTADVLGTLRMALRAFGDDSIGEVFPFVITRN